MNAKCCDRCGRFYKTAESEREEIILAELKGEDLRGVDLCPVCYRQLYRWVKREKNRPHPMAETPEISDGFIFK